VFATYCRGYNPPRSCVAKFEKCPPLIPSQSFSTTAYNKRNRERAERTLRAEELAGDVEGLTSHNDDLLAVEQLLGDSAGQATKEVSFAVDDDLYSRNNQSAITVFPDVPGQS
jgi:hypothetical protein